MNWAPEVNDFQSYSFFSLTNDHCLAAQREMSCLILRPVFLYLPPDSIFLPRLVRDGYYVLTLSASFLW